MKVLVLDRDVEYAQRLKRFIEKHHAMLQLFVCDNIVAAKNTILNEKCDVVLVDAAFAEAEMGEIDAFEKDAAFSFMSERNEIVKSKEAFCKFIPISEMYDKICSLYEKKKNRILQESAAEKTAEKKAKVITFFSVCGGSGSSTMAAVCAISLSRSGKTLYINLEQLSSETAFFGGEGKKGLSDLLALLKTRCTDADVYNQMKEIIVRDEKQGCENLSFIRGYRNAMDCPSMTANGIETIIRIIRDSFDYNYIVLDTGFIAGKVFDKTIMLSDQIVYVSVGSDVANEKMSRIRRYIEIVGRESQSGMPQENIVFNQYYGMKDEELVAKDMRILLRTPRYRTNEAAHISSQTVINTILGSGNVFSEFA